MACGGAGAIHDCNRSGEDDRLEEGWWTAVGMGFLYFWRQNELPWGPGTLIQKSGSSSDVRLTLVVASGRLEDGRGERGDVELLTSALGNVAGQKSATSCLWFTVNWTRGECRSSE
jgi:hypothetical protein